MNRKLDIITINQKEITDFAKTRNEYQRKAKSEWILFLDRDEFISKNDLKKIEESISKSTSDAYFITRMNYFLGHFVGREKILRLMKKDSGFWVRKVHERYLVNKNKKTGVLDVVIIHKTATSLSNYLTKINKYFLMHSLSNKYENKRSTILHIIFYPFLKFVLTFIKSRNFVFSLYQSFHSFLSWVNLYFIQA